MIVMQDKVSEKSHMTAMLVKVNGEYHTHPYYMGEKVPGVIYPGSQKNPKNFDQPLPDLTDPDKNFNQDFDHNDLIDGGSYPKVSIYL